MVQLKDAETKFGESTVLTLRRIRRAYQPLKKTFANWKHVLLDVEFPGVEFREPPVELALDIWGSRLWHV